MREALRLAQQEVSQAQERFRAGVAGNADVFTASLSLNSARTQAVDALSSYQSAKVALARAVGSVTALPYTFATHLCTAFRSTIDSYDTED